MATLRILLADDHTVVRQGLRKVLEERPDWKVVAEAGDGREAVRQAEQLKPDIAILDVAMPLLNGVEATRQIVKHVPGGPRARAQHALRRGLCDADPPGRRPGYLLKDSADVDLLQAVTPSREGKSFFSPADRAADARRLRQAALGRPGIVDRYESLSDREREVFQLIAEGKTNKDIAAILFISPSTVETHRARIMEKLDVHSAAEIVLYAVRRGVIR